MNNKRLRNILSGMKTRCSNPNHKDYKNYGARGIKVCDEWLNDTDLFIKWALNNGYQDNLTIERIDNNGDYNPDNCKWATVKEQQSNTRNNRMLTINGESNTLQQWADKTSLNKTTIHERIKHNKTNKELIMKTRISISGIKGISWNEYSQSWLYRVYKNGKLVFSRRRKRLEDLIIIKENYEKTIKAGGECHR